MLVYCATNTVNGKRYVGVTTRTLATRMVQHRSRAKTGRHAFAQAISKHGFAAFTWTVLLECNSRAELIAAEKRIVEELGTRDHAHGYNRTEGGTGVIGYTYTAEVKARMSRSQTLRYPLSSKRQLPLFHRGSRPKHTAEHKERVRLSLLGKPSRARKLPIGIEATLLLRNEAGESHAALAREFGVCSATVTYAIARARA